MSKESLTTEQLQAAKQLDKTLRSLAKVADQLKHYKLDNIYVLEETDPQTQKTTVQETTLGFPAKFKVVYISDEGIPYIRKITTSGNPTGECFIPPEANALAILKRFANGTHFLGSFNECRFIPDPEQMDAILLQQEFDPMAQQREKSKLYNEINKHNKNIAVDTSWTTGFKSISQFFKSRQLGDKFWTAPDKQFVIQSVFKVGRLYEIKCTDMNQQTVTFNFGHFHSKRLYKEQPRSFTKESVK